MENLDIQFFTISVKFKKKKKEKSMHLLDLDFKIGLTENLTNFREFLDFFLVISMLILVLKYI